MITKFRFSIFLMAIATGALAQYQKISVQGREWNEYTEGMWGPSTLQHYRIDGDTLFKGKSMPRLIETDSSGNFIKTAAIIDEDTVLPSITFYGGRLDSLFLDLSLTVGDSAAFICFSDTNYYILDSLDTYKDLQGINRKQYFYNVESYGFNWVEGLGSIGRGGILNFVPITCVLDVPVSEMICVTDTGGVSLYKNTNFVKCIPDGIGISEYSLTVHNLYPNPASSYIEFEELPVQKITTISFLSVDGRILKKVNNPTHNKIVIEDLPEGIYLLMIDLSDGQKQSARLAIQR